MQHVRDAEVKVERVPLASLKAYDGNAKRHDNANIEAIESSIKEFGFRNPIIAWHNEDGVPEIVAGHGRALAAQKLGIKEVPVVFVDDLSDAQRRMLTLADNQTTLMTGWDEAQLAEELDALSDSFDLSDFGFRYPEAEDEALLDGVSEDSIPDVSEDAEGTAWRLGRHVLVCGDATDSETVLRVKELLGIESFDMVVTDPPYNVALGWHMRPSEAKALRRRTDGLTIDNDEFASDEAFEDFLTAAFANAASVLRAGGAFYTWLATTHTPAFAAAMARSGLSWKQMLVWVKNTIVMGRQDYQWQHEGCLYGWKEGGAHYFCDSRKESTVYEDAADPKKMSKAELIDEVERLRETGYETDVIHCSKPSASEEHPTMKPVKLIARQIRCSSRPNEAVLDMFGGSGTTLVACEQMNRRCGVVELSRHYTSVIIKRWEDLTGDKAERIE